MRHVKIFFKISLLAIIATLFLTSDYCKLLIESFRPVYLLAGLALQPICMMVFLFLTYRHLALLGGFSAPKFRIYKALILAQGLNLVLPARFSEVVKATYLRHHSEVPLSISISAIFLERVIDLMILSILGGICLIVFTKLIDPIIVFSFGAIGIFLIIAILFSKKFYLNVLRLIPVIRVRNFIEHTYLQIHSVIKKGKFFSAIVFGICCWSLSYIAIYTFMKIATDGFTPQGALLLFVFTSFGAAIPLLPGSVGTYEAAGIAALTYLGYSYSESIALVIVLHLSQLAFPVIFSISIMIFEKIGIFELLKKEDYKKITKF